jgi:hypothetical protein
VLCALFLFGKSASFLNADFPYLPLIFQQKSHVLSQISRRNVYMKKRVLKTLCSKALAVTVGAAMMMQAYGPTFAMQPTPRRTTGWAGLKSQRAWTA